MKILTIVGSLRPDSTTGLALGVASRAAEAAGAEVQTVELCTLSLPFCDGRADELSYGGDVTGFIEAVREADGLLIGSPNYHGSLSGVLKNALDLLGPEAVRDKLVGVVATARAMLVP